MPDVHTPKQRSFNMSQVRGKDTKPEIIIRKKLHRAGFRYRLHGKNLPGKPDIVLKKYNAVIFIHGCFWHGHDCHLFKWPKTRKEFWKEKIESNITRDKKSKKLLLDKRLRVMTIWECALKGKNRLEEDFLMTEVSGWLVTDSPFHEIKGR